MPRMKTWTISTLAELELIAVEIAGSLANVSSESATVLALHGNLGAGKTTFVQLLAKQLGITETVTSPTFVIMKSYQSNDSDKPALVHIDAYRIENVDEMRVLGFERLLTEKHTIICIEWAERIESLLPQDTKHLTLELSEDVRTITFK